MTNIKQVNLTISPSDKFKTIQIFLRFRAPMSEETVAHRVMISNLWETANAQYPTNQAFRRRLAELYGASFSSSVYKVGTEHQLNVGMTLVNPKYLPDGQQVFEESLDFLHAVLFQPLLEMGANRPAFDHKTYEIERENLIRYIQSNIEDKSYYASQQLQKLFYGDSALALSSLGSIDLVKAIQPEETYDYYQEMLVTNGLDIMVVGEVDGDQVANLIREKLPFEAREMADISVYREQDVPAPLKTRVEEKPYNQSIFQEIYTVPSRYGSKASIAMQVTSGLLGGFPHSKLFANVREKASLAYYADSSYDAFLGIVRIKAGIDAKNYERARDLIAAQITAMQAGDFSEQDLAITKEMIINAIEQSLDNQYTSVVQADLKAITDDRFLTIDERIKLIKAVTHDDVVTQAKLMQPAAMYLLKGVGTNETNEL